MNSINVNGFVHITYKLMVAGVSGVILLFGPNGE
nr:MAG TPA: hypothetical protein [Caudoviricetes sp.]